MRMIVNQETDYTQVETIRGDQQRTVILKEGNNYRVNPLNPRKTKHHGRRLMILTIYDFFNNKCGKCKVRFLDTNRIGFVDMEDLTTD